MEGTPESSMQQHSHSCQVLLQHSAATQQHSVIIKVLLSQAHHCLTCPVPPCVPTHHNGLLESVLITTTLTTRPHLMPRSIGHRPPM